MSILDNILQWSHAVDKVEAALESKELDAAQKYLLQARYHVTRLEERTQNSKLLPKMTTKVKALCDSLREAWMYFWYSTLRFHVSGDESFLEIHDDLDGNLLWEFTNCSNQGYRRQLRGNSTTEFTNPVHRG